MSELPNAEDLAEQIGRKYHDHGEIGAGSLAPEMLRIYTREVLKGAAQAALDHPEAPAAAILELKGRV